MATASNSAINATSSNGGGGGSTSSSSTPKPPTTAAAGAATTQSQSTNRDTAGAAVAAFTKSMRDRQARGKQVEITSTDEGSDDESLRNRSQAGGIFQDDFAQRERRSHAFAMLDDPDMLMMQALAKGDSLAGQRLYYTRIAYGLPANEEGGRKGRR